MATADSSNICDICTSIDKESTAKKWCPECEEKICADCHLRHSVSKATRHHTVIDIEEYIKIPDSVLEIQNFCDQHDMKYTNLCPQHDKLCCPACISENGPHSGCKTLLLQNVIKTTKTSTLLKSMMDSLRSLKKNIEAIIEDRQTNVQQLHEQRQMIEKEIKQIKETIQTQLDEIERNILDDLNSKVMQKTAKLESEIKDLEKRLSKSEQLAKTTNALVDFGSDLQTYIGSKTMEADVAQETNSLQDLVKILKRFDIKLDKKPKREHLIKKDTLFGFIADEVLPVSLTLVSESNKQAQIISKPPAVSIDAIKLSLKSELSGKRNIEVYGCSVLPSGEIMLADLSGQCVVVLHENGDKEKEIPLSSDAVDVTVINNNTIGVACSEGVKIINITTGNTEKTISTGICTGVEYYNGSLICGVPRKGVVTVDLTSTSMKTLVQVTNNWGPLYCTVYRDNIYVARYDNGTVTCYSLKGNTLWEYKDSSVISGPLGIAVDNSSNVYVASFLNHRVVVLSPDGKKSRTLLTEKDGLYSPTGLHFNRTNTQIMVVNKNGSVYLFS